jgi:hypothetical protein
MSTGCPKKPLTVNPGDQEKLELLARRPKTAQRVAIRSKIVLWAAEGLPIARLVQSAISEDIQGLTFLRYFRSLNEQFWNRCRQRVSAPFSAWAIVA